VAKVKADSSNAFSSAVKSKRDFPSRVWNMSHKDTIGTQIEHNKDTRKTQSDSLGHKLVHKDTIETQIEHNKATRKTQEKHNKDTRETQLEHNYFYDMLLSLYGLEKEINDFIYGICVSKGSLITPAISLATFKKIAISKGKSPHSVKTSLARLVEKNLLIRGVGRRGNGGICIFSIYEKSKVAYLDIRTQLGHNWDTTETQLEHNQDTQKDTIAPSSSNTIVIKGTTTNREMTEEWQRIDISPLEPKEVAGMTDNHLVQLFLVGSLSAAQVQESIHAFAFDLIVNKKKITPGKKPMDLFMGILVRNKMPYRPPTNYKTQEEKALVKLSRKQVQEEFQREDGQSQEFSKWYVGEKSEVIDDLLGGKINDPELRRRSALSYYKQEIWCQKNKEDDCE